MELLPCGAGSRRASLHGAGTSGRDVSSFLGRPTPERAVSVRMLPSDQPVNILAARGFPLSCARPAAALRCRAVNEDRDQIPVETQEGNHNAAADHEEGYPVILRVYNLDRYGLAPMGAKLLKKEVDGIYHVAVAVHDFEFWYDHQVNQQDLNDVEFAFGFGPSYVYDMGRTKLTKKEIEEYAFGPLKEKYHIDTYDCFYNNCHHFANDLCVHITGRRVPQWCIDHGEQGLSELDQTNAAVTRFVTNKIARIMMVSWGKYSKERFVQRQEEKGVLGVPRMDGMAPDGGRGLVIPRPASPQG